MTVTKGTNISEAEQKATLDGTELFPISDGSKKPVTVTANTLKSFVGGGGGGGSTTVVDNLDSTSPTDALSANQGHVIGERVTDLELKVDGWNDESIKPSKFVGYEYYVDENGIVQKRANSNCVCFECGNFPGFAVCAFVRQYLESKYFNTPAESEFILTNAFSQNKKAIQTIKSVGFMGGNGLYKLYVNVMIQETQGMTIELTMLMPSVLQTTAYNVGKYVEHTFNDNEVAVNADTFYNNSIVKVTSGMTITSVESLGYEVVFDVPAGIDLSLGEGVSVPVIGEVDNTKRRMFSFLNGTLVIGNFEE